MSALTCLADRVVRLPSSRKCKNSGLNRAERLLLFPINPRPSAECHRAAMEIRAAVAGSNEIRDIDIRRTCEAPQGFPCCRDRERRVPEQSVAEPRHFCIKRLLRYDRFQISDRKQ